MNATETLALLRYVVACCPAQKVDEYTPDAWTDLLGDLRFVDCKEAARNVAQVQEFIAPKDIRKEVRRIRQKRIDTHPAIEPPADLDPPAYQRWLLGTRRTIADGELITQTELPSRDMSALRQIEKRPA